MDKLDERLKIQAPKFISEDDLLELAKKKLIEHHLTILAEQMELLFNNRASGYKYSVIQAFVDVDYI